MIKTLSTTIFLICITIASSNIHSQSFLEKIKNFFKNSRTIEPKIDKKTPSRMPGISQPSIIFEANDKNSKYLIYSTPNTSSRFEDSRITATKLTEQEKSALIKTPKEGHTYFKTPKKNLPKIIEIFESQ